MGFYDSEDSPVPTGTNVIEITDAQWSAAIQNTTGFKVVSGVLVSVTPTAAQLLATAQTTQKLVIDAAYADAIQQNVSFTTAAGVTETFEADSDSQTLLVSATQGYTIAGATPAGFYWVAADNTQVPFTLADLTGLYQATLAQGWEAFQKRQTLKSQIDAATTVATVQAITWS
ncbi:DUF4376 domain-containing protein [Pararobbsia silviterrae]|uniref:DUF4376 domain-containing protein n=1 Tax=Pararobbsia silviterrae TaxID=1792498 RepID=UPI001314D496|nr:DUF4376 domain-containing protein [Pararobbsia silviterrae]